MTTLLWVHEDMLRTSHPAFKVEHGASCFVFDPDMLRKQGYSMKRIAFLFELATQCADHVYKGNAVEVLTSLCKEHSGLITGKTPNPLLQEILQHFEHACVIEDDPFATPRLEQTPKRFFQYWKRAKKSAMRQSNIG